MCKHLKVHANLVNETLQQIAKENKAVWYKFENGDNKHTDFTPASSFVLWKDKKIFSKTNFSENILALFFVFEMWMCLMKTWGFKVLHEWYFEMLDIGNIWINECLCFLSKDKEDNVKAYTSWLEHSLICWAATCSKLQCIRAVAQAGLDAIEAA